jgi:uncharacterized protein (DUF927 family)
MTDTKAAAKRLFEASSPSIVGTDVETYFQVRGISLLASPPPCLRFAAKLKHPNEQFFPALLVQATNPVTGEPIGGVQRVFLAWGGKGKAQVEKKEQKLSLGPMKGGVARLAEPIEGQPLLIGEGVETVLTAMEASGLPGWSTLGTAGLKAFMPPPGINHVIALAENDGGPNQKALEVLIPALTAHGVRVEIARPPPGLKDFNDCVNGVSGHEAGAGRALVKHAIEAAMAGETRSEGPPIITGDDEHDGKFSMTESGLYRNKNKKWTWVSQSFEVLGLARGAAPQNETAAGWGKLVRFKNPDGKICEEVVTAAMLHSDMNGAMTQLADRGMEIKGTVAARRSLAEFLIAAKAETRVTIAHSTGWIESDSARAFVIPGAIIGDFGDRIVLAKNMGAPYSQRGTLADWRNAIAIPAGNHLMMRFCLSTALAGPLLWLGGYESGIFHLFGQSSIGKTTLLRVAASVWGSGADNGYVRVWRATANGLEANMAGACDTLLPLDEVGQVDGKEIGQAIYMASSGVGKTRMTKDATLKASHKWRLPILSSGEQPIGSKLVEDTRHGKRAFAGQLVRAIDIQANRGPAGVFDHYPDFDSKAFTAEMKQAASRFYGTPGPEFVRRLIERGIDGDIMRAKVATFVEVAFANAKDYHGQVGRAAERFGLIAAAGELAIELSLLPWSEPPRADALALFKDWLEARGGAVPAEVRQIVEKVRYFLEAHGGSRFEDLDRPPTHPVTLLPSDQRIPNRAGYRRGKGAKQRWLILPQVWREEVCQGFNPTEVAKILHGFGMLEPGENGELARKQRLPNGQGTQRFYVVTPSIFEGWEE